MNIYDEHFGDIWFDEEDPHSINYNPAYCRNVYIDLAFGVFDYNDDPYYDDSYYDEYCDYDDRYYDADDEFDDY
jgi:hypothetical protein